MNTSIKNIAVFTLGLLSVLSSCGGDFLDNKPTDAVDSGIVPVPSNAGRIFNGAWYNLFEYSSTYANIGYRALMLQDDMMADDVVSRPMWCRVRCTASTHPISLTMWGCLPTTAPHLPGI